VSAIQLIAAASAIANDGVLMKPMLVKEITDRSGRTVKRYSPEPVRRVIASHTAATVRRILKTVITEGGTGVNAALDGYTVCGKTGTAQKIDESGSYAKGSYLASFIGIRAGGSSRSWPSWSSWMNPPFRPMAASWRHPLFARLHWKR
jgi:cell division protein FtsI (penicillin-binding protein 3)